MRVVCGGGGSVEGVNIIFVVVLASKMKAVGGEGREEDDGSGSSGVSGQTTRRETRPTGRVYVT